MTKSKMVFGALVAMAASACSTGVEPATETEESVGTTQSALFGATETWHGNLCVGNMECQIGDVDGDGDDDAIIFMRNVSEQEIGRVYVALNNGASFGNMALWHSGFCSGSDQCHVGDVNGDGKADLIAFPKTATELGVYVAKSTGTSFGGASLWNAAICDPGNDCRIGDFNGDGKTDVIAFVKGTDGSIYVALSNGSRFNSATRWGSGCFNNEVCRIGKVNAGSASDVITLTHRTSANPGEVYVRLSNGSSAFGTSTRWRTGYFPTTTPGQVVLGDVTGDGLDDLVAFVQNGTEPSSPVVVSRSTGSAFDPNNGGVPWKNDFCGNGSSCRVGRANTDAKLDAFAFINFAPGFNPDNPLKGDAQVTKSQ